MQAVRAAVQFCRPFSESGVRRFNQSVALKDVTTSVNGGTTEQMRQINDLYEKVGSKTTFPAVWAIGLGFTGVISACIGYTHQQTDRKIGEVRDDIKELRRETREDFKEVRDDMQIIKGEVQEIKGQVQEIRSILLSQKSNSG